MKRVLIFVAIWVAFGLLLCLFALQRPPSTALGWGLLIVLGPPAYLLMEFVGEGASNLFRALPGIRHIENYAERRSAAKAFSGLRIVVQLVVVLLFAAVLGGVVLLVLHALSR